MEITFRTLNNNDNEFNQIHRWCKNKFVYEWFEQRILSVDEITNKYKNKLKKGIQKLFIIQYNDMDIGLLQLYKFEHDINLKKLKQYKNIYEYDLFIGIEEYLSKGLGTIIVNLVNQKIYNEYKADAIILRPFKRNIRAIKCYEKAGFKIINEYDGKDTLGKPEVISVLLKEVFYE